MTELLPWLLALTSTAAWARSAARRHPARAACGLGAQLSTGASWDEPSFTFRVGTYNIHRGKGLDGRRNLRRIAAHLGTADLVAIHEAGRPLIPGQPDDIQRLANFLHCGYLFLPSQNRFGSDCYGNGLLTRAPILNWYREPLVDRTHNKFRTLTVTHLPLPDGRTCAILITHLSKRSDQSDQLRRALTTFQQHDLAILLGDFNATRHHPLLRDFINAGHAQDAIASSLGPADPPTRIDWILTRGLTPQSAGIVHARASDHPYYWADVKIPHQSPPRPTETHRSRKPSLAQIP